MEYEDLRKEEWKSCSRGGKEEKELHCTDGCNSVDGVMKRGGKINIKTTGLFDFRKGHR